jgi:5-(carboxyamino)imidazole ribonucleotide synthase
VTIFSPGSTIGIIGGGQLGRMTALAAANLGLKTHIYCPDKDCPAGHVSDSLTVGSYTDRQKIAAFAASVDVVTFEFENIPHETVQLIASKTIVRPGWEVLHISQNRLREKDFVNSLGIATAPYKAISSIDELRAAADILGFPCILKTTEQGYDGKGQFLLKTSKDLELVAGNLALETKAENSYILEGFVRYTKEISVILARGIEGETSCFSPSENQHVGGILDITIAPARISPALAQTAQNMARSIADNLALVGMIAVEFFVTEDERLLVNEMAPRPHNSGHWTIDACITSQFEQFVRAVCGLPFGSVKEHSYAVMQNLIGEQVQKWPDYINEPETKLHIYGKSEVKEGRKMGHITRLYPVPA